MKIIINESQLKRVIESNTPQMNPTDYYSIFVGYLDYINQDLGSKKTVEQLATIKELMIYYENMRDGLNPKPLSNFAKKMNDWMMVEFKKLNGQQLKSLREKGLTIKHV